jgi:hypothetical protein
MFKFIKSYKESLNCAVSINFAYNKAFEIGIEQINDPLKNVLLSTYILQVGVKKRMVTHGLPIHGIVYITGRNPTRTTYAGAIAEIESRIVRQADKIGKREIIISYFADELDVERIKNYYPDELYSTYKT